MEKNTNLISIILDTLDSNKALDIISIDLKNKSSMADYMIIASGTSSRHIQALSEQVLEKLKANGVKNKYVHAPQLRGDVHRIFVYNCQKYNLCERSKNRSSSAIPSKKGAKIGARFTAAGNSFSRPCNVKNAEKIKIPATNAARNKSVGTYQGQA